MPSRSSRLAATPHRSRSARAARALGAGFVVALLSCAPSRPAPASAAASGPVALSDESKPFEARAVAIVSQLTLEEKIGQMMNDAPAIERLGIPAYDWCSEALHGVARAGLATSFPQAIGLAATWDEPLMLRVATAISDEARAKHHAAVARGSRQVYQGLTLWSPNINLLRDPRWGRGQETYGEDPFLSGRLAVQFVRGLQGDDPRYLKTVATLKHFAVHSGPEPLRHEFDAQVGMRDLQQTYLPQFEMGVREGQAQSVMCAYNRVNGAAACAHDQLLGGILRGDWGFSGYVVSDCRAIADLHAHHRVTESPAESAALAVRKGTDLECGRVYQSLFEAVGRGLVSEAELDESLRRLFLARLRLGMFDDPAHVPYAQIPPSVVDSAEHRKLAVEAAEKSFVLLKNDGVLPLARDLSKIAVVGPNANEWLVLLGNYNGVPARAITPLEGIRSAVSPGTEVAYAQGSELADGVPVYAPVPSASLRTAAGGQGIDAFYYGDSRLSAEPVRAEIAPAVDAQWGDGAPLEGLDGDDFGVVYRGKLVARASGPHRLGVLSTCNTVVSLNGEVIVETKYHRKDEYADPRLKKSIPLELLAGQSYDIEITARETYGGAGIQLVWAEPRPKLKQEALEAAASADAVVMVMGLSANLEGERLDLEVEGFDGGDRTRLDLPAPQRQLVREVVALGKPVVLVVMSGSAMALEWEQQNASAILAGWYPGQAAGEALANVLFGAVSPSGRLPLTFYHSARDLPPFEDYHITTQTYRFFPGEPLYPFGHGLSYTRFHYDQLELPETLRPGQELHVSGRVTNVGERAGEEVVQAYVGARERTPGAPLRSLAGFRRVRLEPGESARVELSLWPQSFATFSEQGAREYLPGAYDISLGGGQPLPRADATSDVAMGSVVVTAP